MKKHNTAPSTDDAPPLAKRKTSRRSPEGDAEEEADAKWDKKVKVEPGIDVTSGSSKRPKTEQTTANIKGHLAMEALKRRRAESASASTPTSTAPSNHASVVDCALKVLTEVPLDDDRFVPSAIKTFTEDHINAQLPPPFSLSSEVPFVVGKLRDRHADQERKQHFFNRLRKAEAVTVASWISSTIPDRELLQLVCALLLESTSTSARSTSASNRTPQPPATDPSKAIPTPPSSSRTNSANGAEFDLQGYSSSNRADRREFVRLQFTRSIDFFTYHIENFVRQYPAATTPSWPHPPDFWSRLDEEQRGKWEQLLSRVHIDGLKCLLKKEAYDLLAEQLFQPVTPETNFPDSSPGDGEETQGISTADSEQFAAPSVETCEAAKPVEPSQRDHLKRSPSEVGRTTPLADIPPPSAPIPPHHLFTRPTFVPFVPHNPIPNTYSVLLPINTPTCPIPDATTLEVRQSCLTVFGHQHGDASVEQVSPHAWIVSFTGKPPHGARQPPEPPPPTPRLQLPLRIPAPRTPALLRSRLLPRPRPAHPLRRDPARGPLGVRRARPAAAARGAGGPRPAEDFGVFRRGGGVVSVLCSFWETEGGGGGRGVCGLLAAVEGQGEVLGLWGGSWGVVSAGGGFGVGVGICLYCVLCV
ncbi:hypothetical protein M409DRAFT_60345 [Zasmidium cellare ATCC 36951]|uniref:Uncharacterized protein n=1 Tax=Zasmidium cellare ATCC 36951 TaxID=1080233 RepID=A0A6A6BYR9_ZASCE|nr:uncharacterized protein M409DRAFT_60345 [Zasmidium cellare ATCC 36951]KAF2159931.1 hypothetical protein M409DRAFT_60345 [Zasmidium cellare ATCC 36951]